MKNDKNGDWNPTPREMALEIVGSFLVGIFFLLFVGFAPALFQ